MPATPRFTPLHRSHRGTVTVMAPADETLALFTPEGERRWVPDWAPDYLFRAGGGDEIDTVFRTAHDNEETYWIVLEHDLEEHAAAYARITPGSRLGTVTIDVEPIDETSCWVEVCYEMTAMTPAGNAALKQFDRKAFEAMLAEWQERIAAALNV